MSKSIQSVSRIAALAGILALASGCAHPLVVKNIDTYRVSGGMAQTTSKSIGVVSTTASYDDQVIMNGVADGLRRCSEKVVAPYSKGSERKVDVIANIGLLSQYEGSGVNFLISWPGFLIWTPAWNGYVYNIKHNFSVRLENGKTDATLETFNIPVDLDIRHAAMNRTALAECGGWFFYSVPCLIGGIFHIGYDDNVTPIAAKEVAAPLGDFVAQEIVRRIPKGSMQAETTKSDAVKPESKTSLDASLRELNKLKEDGLITQEEFDVKKKSLLEKY